MTPPAHRADPAREASPPFWWPLLAGAPIALSLAVMALPELEHRHALIYRAFYLALFLAWTLPLTWLQRRLWARGARWATLCGVVLAVTYVMSVLSNAFGRMLGTALGRPATETAWVDLVDGLDSCWLSLIAYAAVHAVVAHAFELRSERERLARATAATRDAELHALRYQLQPHFLFNTLNAVSSLIAEARNAEAQAMISRLGEFLRATLDARAAHEVALAEELASAESYLDIERVRLGPRLKVKWRVGADVLRARVPTLLLQPLIENAIRHGIAPRTAPGRLEVAIDRVGARLRIVVENDLADAPSAGPDAGGDVAGRIGLRNLDERLRALYPETYRLRAGRSGDARFVVEVELPFRDATAPADAVR
ncbi:MAG: sensor histidine kinase [Pseudomonadota bacterium]